MDEDNLYTIKKGDTFWDLEREWGIPYGTLSQINSDLDPRKLQIGKQVKIKMPSIIYLIAEEIPQVPNSHAIGNSILDNNAYQTKIDNTYVHNPHLQLRQQTPSFSNSYRENKSRSFAQTALKTTVTAKKIIGLENLRRSKLLFSNELWHLQKNGTLTHQWKNMSNGASHWKNNIVANHRSTFQTSSKAKALAPKAMKFAGGLLLAADIGLSGEVKPSHVVTAVLLGASTTGVGAVFAGIYFIADIGTGLVTGTSISERLDGWVAEDYGRLELYEGLY